jgi:sporulation protein YlmC with PRC-barrel domain
VIYVSKGSYLGDLTDELDGAHITTFASGGPKNYSYETSKGKTVCKVRGITLNYRTRQFINHKVVCDMVFLNAFSNENDTITIDIPHKIVRDTKEKDIITKSEKKDYRIVYNKRRIVNSFDTLPYGF